MEFLDHLHELRKRLIYIFLTIFVFSIISLTFIKDLFPIFSDLYFSNFKDQTLIGTSPQEAFFLKIKISIFFGLLLSSPLCFFQVWKFIEPGLHKEEKKYLFPFILCTSILFILGILFCYKIVLPISLSFFFAQYQSLNLTPTIKINNLFSLVLKTSLAFAIIFQIPIISFFLGKFKIINSSIMKKYFRWIIVFIFILSAILTPPDVISQFLLAVPMIILYLISILIVKKVNS